MADLILPQVFDSNTPQTVEPPKSKYTITDIPGGFLIQREGGLELGVTYGDTYLHIGTHNVGLYSWALMMTAIADHFLDGTWKHYIKKQNRLEGREMISKALSRRVKPAWERVIKEVAPKDVSDLARLMWSSVHGDCSILHIPELYTDKYKHVRSDLRKYHACRLFAREIQENIADWCETNRDAHLLDRLANWRNILAPNAASPKAANKTLDKLPRGLGIHQLRNLEHVHLQQPITNRLHMIAVLTGADHHHWNMHEAVMLRASESAIKEAADIWGWSITAKSKVKDIAGVIRNIMDYPDAYNGDVVGLARRSREWHDENQRRYAEDRWRVKPALPPNHKLPLLPFDYDKLATQGIVPLRTVGEVENESEVMHHCVATYAQSASEGYSYLFHVEHKGEVATIELDSKGTVRQAQGKYNSENGACKWGSDILARAERTITPVDGAK